MSDPHPATLISQARLDAARPYIAMAMKGGGSVDDCIRAAIAAADQAGWQPSPTHVWLILFDDPDRPMERFYGHGAEDAARRRYELMRPSWSCHLLATLKSSVPRDEFYNSPTDLDPFCPDADPKYRPLPPAPGDGP